MVKIRLDQYLAQEGFFETRTKALYEIKNGNVAVNGRIVHKPSRNVGPGDQVCVQGKTLEYPFKNLTLIS